MSRPAVLLDACTLIPIRLATTLLCPPAAVWSHRTGTASSSLARNT